MIIQMYRMYPESSDTDLPEKECKQFGVCDYRKTLWCDAASHEEELTPCSWLFSNVQKRFIPLIPNQFVK